MNKVMMAAVLGFALAGAGCDVAVSGLSGGQVVREDKRFAVTGPPTLDLQTFDGSIAVRTGAATEVLVTIERRAPTEEAAKAIQVTAEQNGDRISLHVERPQRGLTWGNRSASFVVTVPPSAAIQARSGDGSIKIEGVAGALQSHTGDGSIRLTGVDGAIDVSSGDGSIGVSGKIAQLHARSGDGSVTIEAAPGSAPSADWDVTTGDGSVTLGLPADLNAEFDAHTGDGGIRVRDLSLAHVTGEMGKNDLRGTLGRGGHTVRVRTGDGSITLKRF